MKRLDLTRLLLLALLGTTCVVLAVRIAGHLEAGGRVLELGRNPVTRIDPRTRDVLGSLEGRLYLTYYVSGAEHMPSHMRRVEGDVTDLFRALEAAVPGKVAYQIVDPARVPELAGFSARRRIAPRRRGCGAAPARRAASRPASSHHTSRAPWRPIRRTRRRSAGWASRSSKPASSAKPCRPA